MAIVWITPEEAGVADNEVNRSAIESASWILYKLSGQKYAGLRSATEWYGFRGSSCFTCQILGVDTAEMNSAVGHFHNFDESPVFPQRLRLRGQPVRKIHSVEVGETTLSVDSYELINSAYIVKTNKTDWNMLEGVTVSYQFGNRPPEAGRRAVITLAKEFILLETDPAACSLPSRVTSVSRQGLSFDMFDPREFLSDGRTGILEVDMFIAAANPRHSLMRPRVFIADSPHGERTN